MTRTRTLLVAVAVATVVALIPTPAHAATVGSPYTRTDNVGDAPQPADLTTATFTNNASIFKVAFQTRGRSNPFSPTSPWRNTGSRVYWHIDVGARGRDLTGILQYNPFTDSLEALLYADLGADSICTGTAWWIDPNRFGMRFPWSCVGTSVPFRSYLVMSWDRNGGGTNDFLPNFGWTPHVAA